MHPQSDREFEHNLERVKERLDRAARRSGRDASAVRIMAVAKTFPATFVEMAWRCGVTLFGENRVQEAERKYIRLPEELELHLVGHLQRNKARKAAAIFSWVDSVDKIETAAALESEAGKLGKTIDILLEFNSSGEETKFGVKTEEQLLSLAARCREWAHLRVRGLMTLGPYTGEESRIRAAFRQTRLLFEKAARECPALPFDTLSMGMSGDFEVAVEEGSTMVRLGTALFGPRSER
jgi:pyridoxal phosphate enzyme (YggS family)